jgi:arsenate reductase (thioredoxin)
MLSLMKLGRCRLPYQRSPAPPDPTRRSIRSLAGGWHPSGVVCAGAGAHAESARTEPDRHGNERTVQLLQEVGIDVSDVSVTRAQLEQADRVISLGCPLPTELAAAAAGKIEEWPMPDTTGKPVGAVREVRELIKARVDQLVAELGGSKR